MAALLVRRQTLKKGKGEIYCYARVSGPQMISWSWISDAIT